MKGKKHKSSKHNYRGGFHDLASFREESGLTIEDLSDQEAVKVIAEDARNQAADAERKAADAEHKAAKAIEHGRAAEMAAAEKERAAAEKERAAAEKERIAAEREKATIERAAAEKITAQNEITVERGKRRILENIIDPYTTDAMAHIYGKAYDPLFMLSNKYLEKERTKREILNELREDTRLKNTMKGHTGDSWDTPTYKSKPHTKSRSKSRSKPRTKSRSKSRTKSRSKSRSKSHKK